MKINTSEERKKKEKPGGKKKNVATLARVLAFVTVMSLYYGY